MSRRLQQLGLGQTNPGVSSAGGWHRTPRAPRFASLNPATNRPIAEVMGAMNRDYEELMGATWEAFLQWREVPAPRRGEAIRLIADALRRHRTRSAVS